MVSPNGDSITISGDNKPLTEGTALFSKTINT